MIRVDGGGRIHDPDCVENGSQSHAHLKAAPLLPFSALLLALATFVASLPGPAARVEREFYTMGTALRARVEAASSDAASRALEDAASEVERLAALLSTWDPATPMSVVNHAPVGEPTSAPAELVALLVEAEAWARGTGRAFDPAVGALVDAWDLRGEGRHPDAGALATALEAVGPGAFSVDATAGTLTRHVSAAWIDTGAFGKGAALRAAATVLRRNAVDRALLDLGGQILAVTGIGQEPWTVAVAHPSRRMDAAAWLRLTEESVATSGNSERGLVVDGRSVGHILDPRTGEPVPFWGSVTVVSVDPLVADILSTALYVMGPNTGLAWAEELPDVGVLFLIEVDGKIQTLHNQAMNRWLSEAPASAGTQDTSSPERRLP